MKSAQITSGVILIVTGLVAIGFGVALLMGKFKTPE